ncbi:MAG: 5-formyltetrahydrofolate cyclo-ligase [Tannerella sp.]|jgi:5-formyltetrahydrofolate cyclo-ligase|nr:5-formyltetrahydrofolate cyclo-ligase [Tannerella sp.]
MTDGKQLIRKEISEYKKTLNSETAAYLSQTICRRLVQTEVFRNARSIALYCALPDEVQTAALIEDWRDRKTISLPVVEGENIDFHVYEGKEKLVRSAFGILSPDATMKIPREDIDLVIVPGVAFDRKCNRIGRGKGFYDRFLTGSDKPAVGLCFGFQLKEAVSAETHDRQMDMVITEDEIIVSPRRR